MSMAERFEDIKEEEKKQDFVGKYQDDDTEETDYADMTEATVDGTEAVTEGSEVTEAPTENTQEPTVEADRVVMYTSRHSRASNYLYSPGATVSGLAQMMGRSANTIATYVHFLTSNKDIAQFDDNCVI